MARWRDGDGVGDGDGDGDGDGEEGEGEEHRVVNSPGLEIDVRWLCENNRDKS